MEITKIIRYGLYFGIAIAILLAGAGYALLHTAAFNRYATAKIVDEMQSRTGTRVEIDKMAIHWSQLGLNFYGFRLYGAGTQPSEPLFQTKHLRVGLKIVSIFRRKIDLNEIILDQPTIAIRINAQGQSNIPSSASSSGSSFSTDTLFDMAIQHVTINSGEFYFQDRQIPISADVHNLQAHIDFGTFSQEYKGSISYEQGKIVTSNFKPVQHNAQLDFTADRTGLVINRLDVAMGRTHASIHAKVTNYSAPHMEGDYDGVIFTPEMASALDTASLPAGQVSTTGTFRYQYLSGHPFLDSLYLSGGLASPELTIRAGRAVAISKSVFGNYELSNGDIKIDNLKADLLGGHLVANAQIKNLTGRVSSIAVATVQNISLADASDVLLNRRYKRLRVNGIVNGKVQTSWSGNFRDMMIHSRIALTAPRPSTKPQIAQTPSLETIPLSGLIDVQYDGVHNTLSFGQSHLQTGNTEISLTGTVSRQSSLEVQANTTDVYETIALVTAAKEALAPSTDNSALVPLDLHGSAHLSGRVSGSMNDPHLNGQFAASDITARGSHWRVLRGDIDLVSSGISVQRGYLENVTRGKVSFDARVGLSDWSFNSASPVSIDTSASDASVSDLMQLAGLQYPVTGTLSAKLFIQGSEQNPSGHGSIEFVKGMAWKEPINNLAIDFQGADGAIRMTARLQAPAGVASAKINYSVASGQYDGSVNMTGIKLEQIQAVRAQKLKIGGALTAKATGHGTLKDPQIDAGLQIAQLQIGSQAISQMSAQLTIAHRQGKFDVTSVIAQGNVEAKGDVNLTGDFMTDATVDVHALPIGSLLASYFPSVNSQVKGQTELHATLNGPLRKPEQIQGHLEIPTLNLAYEGTQIALVRPLQVDYRNGIATVNETEFKGSGTDITLHGVVPIKNAAQFNIAANGTVDLSILQGLGSGVKSSGQVEIKVNAQGNSSHPSVQGNVRLLNAAFSSMDTPIGFENMNGEFGISGNRIDIRKLEGTAGGGNVTAEGFLTYGPQPSFNVDMHAKSVRIRYPRGLRAILQADLRVNGSSQSSQISGQVLVDRLSFTEGFDLGEFMSQFSQSSSGDSASSFQQKINLNVSLKTSQDVNLSSSKLSMQGAANLNITGTLATPVLLGRATIDSGEIFFMGKRYEIQSGALEFANPLRTNPVVNVYAKTTVEQYNITINFVGPVDRLRTNFTSDPALSTADIINLIAFGKTSEESASSGSQPAALGAESVLAQGVSSQVSGRIEKLAGLSQLSISPTLGNSQQNPGAQVAIQQHITGNILLTFSSDVTTTQGQTVQVQYKSSKQTSVSIVRDQNGGYAIDVRYHKEF